MSVKAEQAVFTLVVDDEREFAETLARGLSERGYKTRVALSGPEALRLLEAEPCDVVVLDLNMPDMDGLMVLDEIQRRCPGTQVLVLTGFATVASGIEGMRRGAADYLLKPVDLKTLCAAIDVAAQRARELHVGKRK